MGPLGRQVSLLESSSVCHTSGVCNYLTQAYKLLEHLLLFPVLVLSHSGL